MTAGNHARAASPVSLTMNPAIVTLTAAMSPSSAIVGVTQVSLVGNATPGATVSETDVGPDGKTNGPFTTVANSAGTYNMGPFLLTQLGAYTGTLRDSISGQTKTITYGGTGDFSASVNTTSRTITAGQSASYTVTFSSIGGFSGVVTPAALNWSNVPGATASWSSTQVTVPSNGSAQATFTIQTAVSTTAGTYGNIILNGKNGAFTRAAPAVSLTVNPTTVTLTGAMSPSSAIVGVTQVSLVGNATPGATVSETDVGPDGKTNGPFTTVANSSGTYNMGPFLLTQLGTYTGTLRDSISGQTKTITYGGTGDFSASVNTTSRTITAGQSASYTVTFSSIGGFSGVVTPAALNWSNIPGATGSWSPTQVTVPSNGSVQATFTIQTAASTTAGTYGNIILSGKNGAFNRSVPAVSLTVNPTTVTLTGAMSPSSAIVGVTQVSLVGNATPGATVSETDIGPDGGTNGPFTTVANSSGTYNMGPFLLTQLGTYTGTLRDSISGQTKTITYGGTGDFSASVNTTSRTVTAGQSTSYTVTFSSIGGFSGVVTPAALNWSNVPGATASWSPTQVTVPSNSSVQATFTIQTATSTTAGTYGNIILNGKNGAFTRAAPAVSLTVNPATLTLTGAMSPSSAIVGVTQVSLVGNATPGATVSETDVGPDGKTNGPFTTVANSSGVYNMGPFLLTQLGTYTGTLRDSISGQTKTITYGGTGDFSASVNTTSRPITAGQSTSYTVTFSSIGGFTGVVTPAALNWSNIPAATASWSPTQVTVPSNSSAQATFTIQTATSTTAGTYGNIILDGKNGAFSRSVPPVSLTVNQPTSVPTISNMTTSPNPPIAGQFNFTITGLNYNTSNAEVFFIGPGCSTSTSCVVTALTRNPNTLSGPATLTSGQFTVQVRNGSSGTPSGTWPLVVNAPAITPTISNMTTSPNPPVAGQFNFTITGLNYNTSNAEVFFIGPGCSTSTSCVVTALTRDTNKLTGPANLAGGSFTVQVRNGPGGIPSTKWPLTVGATPTADSPLKTISIEITQGIQDLKNSYQKFVAGKKTFVRVHVKSSIPTNFYYATSELVASRNGVLLGKISPINSQGAIWVTAFPSRAILNDSFLFELPTAWLSGTIDIEFRGINYQFACLSSTDQSCNKGQISFVAVPRVELVLVRIGWYDLFGAYLPSDEEMNAVEAELRSTLPLSDFVITRSEISFSESGRPSIPTILNRLLDLRSGCVRSAGFRARCDKHYMAIVPNPALLQSPTGISYTPGYVGLSYIGNVQQLNASHEFGHQLGQNHVKKRGDEKCPDPNYPSARRGLISEDQSDGGFFGFNIFSKRIYTPNSTEVMAYTGRFTYDSNEPVWISDYTSRGIVDRLISTGAAFPETPPPCPFGTAAASSQSEVKVDTAQSLQTIEAGTDVMYVSGFITPNDDAGEIQQVFTDRVLQTTGLPDLGTYAIRLERAGEVLATYGFEPDVLSDESTRIFNFPIPASANATRLVLLHNGKELHSRTASAHAPSVTVTSPNGGEVLSGKIATVAWTGFDPDGDSLRYIVQLSLDGGQTWETIASHLTANSINIDLTAIAASSSASVKVLATDGFFTAHDESDRTFKVEPHAPRVSLISPENGAVFVTDQTIIFNGDAVDAEDGILNDSALTWSSNVDGLLGGGRSIAVNALTLSEGQHTITLTARDSNNQTAATSTTIQVARSRPSRLASMAVVPASLNFLTGTGNTETPADIIAIRNDGDGSLSWTATADQTWIHLGATSGSAPANLLVSTNPAGLAAGQYVGHVNITSSDSPNTIMSVTITLSITNIPQAAATIFTEQDTTNRAAALDSVTWLRGPFRILSNNNFSSDHHTRVILFTSDLGLAQPDPSQLTVRAGGVILTVENVGPVMGVNGLNASYIVVRLPDALPTGDLPLTVTLRGVASVNSPTLSIVQ